MGSQRARNMGQGLIRSFGWGQRKRRAQRNDRAASHASLQMEKLDPRELLAGDLVGSWRADSLALTLTDGQVITAWTDSVSQFTTRTDGSPKLAVNGIGGRPAVRFDASDGNDSLSLLSTNNPLSGAKDFSVAVMFRTDSTKLEGQNGEWYTNTGIVDADQLSLARDWGVSINAAGQISAGVTGGGTKTTLYGAGKLNDGQGHVAVLTKAGSTISLYVDGQQVATRNDADAESRAVSGAAFGSLLSKKGYFTGDIGEVRMYNGGLTGAEVTTVSNAISSFYNNRAPVAVADSYTVAEDTPVFLVTKDRGVLANDTDADGDPLTAKLVSSPSHGSVVLNADGSFVYDSDSNYNGPDSFTYAAADFRAGNTVTVSINVTAVYDPVQTKVDAYKGRPGQTLSVDALIGVLANDTNPDRAALSAVVDTPPAQGKLTLQTNGAFTYDPQGFSGRTTFTYRVNDGTQLSAPQTVNLAITSPPQANPDTFTVNEDAQLSILDLKKSVLQNDVDAEGDPLAITLVETTQHGELTISPNGAMNYKPVADFNGVDTFTYKVNDGFDDSNVTTATIQVISVNDLPTAQPDGYVVLPNSTLSVLPTQGLLVNDTDQDGPVLSAVLAAGPKHGTLELQPNGSFSYTPQAGFTGVDDFTYRASDSIDQTAPMTVRIGVSTQPLEISEFLANNLTGLDTRTKVLPTDRFKGEKIKQDWLEIHNLFDFAYNIGGMHLTDDAGDPLKWTFPPTTMIPANGYLVVFASGLNILDPTQDERGYLHTNFGLSSGGEHLAVTAADGSVIYSFGTNGFSEQRPDMSFGRGDNGVGYLQTSTPGAANTGNVFAGIPAGPTIDHDHGFFTQPIQVTITNHDLAAHLLYTVDGSDPTEANGIAYTGPITIDKTTVLRSAAFRDGYLKSRTDTRSFIFLADVLQQSLDGKPPAGWPTRWGANATDYGMDPEIVNSATWGPQMMEALTQIPSMSIVTDLANLYDARTGIYSHASNDGITWERPASLELINPDGKVGFQHNIGLRIRGGYSRDSGNPKHAFRVFFDSPYGDGWLNYPLFEEEGAQSFAKVDLRTSQNYSWSFDNSPRNTFLRDIFSRDLQGKLGHEYTKGRYYHLYINGQYFGLYETDERPEANFAASYYGGSPDDFDVIHNDPRQNGATNGNLEAYQRLWQFFVQAGGLSDANMASYYRAQGMNPDGTRNPAYERLLDVDSLIDYMIITYYTSDADGPGSKFTRPGLNNYFTIFNRKNPDGFKFFEHDSEHSLDTGDAAGANYNMVTPLVNNGKTFPNFNPHYMHEQLANSNSDYLIRFKDRVKEVFADKGILGSENVLAMLDRRASQFDKAIIAESARWGDSKRAKPFTKDDWVKAVATTKKWITTRPNNLDRRGEVLTQLAKVNWWNFNVASPVFSQEGGTVAQGFKLSVTLQGDGDIYLTTDGSDPRDSGGGISAKAVKLKSGDQITINTGVTVRARAQNTNGWSPLTESQFLVEPAATNASLRVSELHYHPSAPTDAEVAAGFTNSDQFEFIELVNISDKTIDLSGVQFKETVTDFDRQGITFNFADGSVTKLAPGAHVLVVQDQDAFEARYGTQRPVAGEFQGGLSNSGERITLQMLDGSQQQFTYSDKWYPNTDGNGPSLEIVNAKQPDLASWSTSTAWKYSLSSGGTPGTGSPLPGDVNGDGLFDETDLIAVLAAGKFEDATPNNASYNEGDWDGDGDFTTLDFVLVFRLGTYQSSAARAAAATPAATVTQDDVDSLRKRSLTTPDDAADAVDAAYADWEEVY